MKPPMDHQAPRRRAYADATGRHAPERLSEYFDFTSFPEKAQKGVTRSELLALLTRWHQVQHATKWYRRLWVWLRRKPGSEPPVTPEPKP